MMKNIRCKRCDIKITDVNTVVVYRPWIPFKFQEQYFHASCFNYNRYQILPKYFDSEQQSESKVDRQ